jgi:hypothetical protein
LEEEGWGGHVPKTGRSIIEEEDEKGFIKLLFVLKLV